MKFISIILTITNWRAYGPQDAVARPSPTFAAIGEEIATKKPAEAGL
jgi:hypothetical protein